MQGEMLIVLWHKMRSFIIHYLYQQMHLHIIIIIIIIIIICATSRTVPGSIPGGVTGFFSDIFSSDQTDSAPSEYE